MGSCRCKPHPEITLTKKHTHVSSVGTPRTGCWKAWDQRLTPNGWGAELSERREATF